MRLPPHSWALLAAAALADGAGVVDGRRPAMMRELRGWLPLRLPPIGSALALHGAPRLLPALRP